MLDHPTATCAALTTTVITTPVAIDAVRNPHFGKNYDNIAQNDVNLSDKEKSIVGTYMTLRANQVTKLTKFVVPFATVGYAFGSISNLNDPSLYAMISMSSKSIALLIWCRTKCKL